MQILNSEKILSSISIPNQPLVTHLEVFDTLDSTNTYLLAQAKHHLASGYICFAEEQTAGRGRAGKSWDSPKYANIYCSMLWNFPLPQNNFSTLSLAVAVIIKNALRRIGLQALVQLKWPNDVYVNQRKLAGILIETIPHADRISAVIGIGLNCHKGQTVANNAICLDEIFPNFCRNELAGILIDELLIGLPVFSQEGMRPFLDHYQKCDMLLGKYILIRNSDFELPGIAEGVDSQGELKVRNERGVTQSFRCGEVSIVLNQR